MTSGARDHESDCERRAEARQGRADAAVRRMQVRQPAGPEPEPLRLRDPLVEREADELGADHPWTPQWVFEDVCVRVVVPGDEPVGE